eukprot:747091-Hanusia_phi.AAC.1
MRGREGGRETRWRRCEGRHGEESRGGGGSDGERGGRGSGKASLLTPAAPGKRSARAYPPPLTHSLHTQNGKRGAKINLEPNAK